MRLGQVSESASCVASLVRFNALMANDRQPIKMLWRAVFASMLIDFILQGLLILLAHAAREKRLFLQ